MTDESGPGRAIGKSPFGPSVLWQIGFFVLVGVYSVPFWRLGQSVPVQLMPGLPISALAVVCPGAAAITLVLAHQGPGSVLGLLSRLTDWRRGATPAGLVLAVCVPLAVNVGAFLVQRLIGFAVPMPHFAMVPTLVLALLFLFAAACEELGWTGFALEPLLERFGAAPAAIIIGVAWAAWHFVPLTQVHRPFAWIAWWTLGTVATRFVMVWLYANAGKSLLGAVLLHAMNNLCWQLYPIHGSYFDPAISGVLMTIVAIALLIAGAAAERRIRRTLTPR